MMVFDFIRKRAEEGIAQVQNIASKTAEGKFAEALGDTAAYVKKRQEIDAENLRKLSDGLAKSRARLMGDLDSIFGSKEDIGLTKTLDKVRRRWALACACARCRSGRGRGLCRGLASDPTLIKTQPTFQFQTQPKSHTRGAAASSRRC